MGAQRTVGARRPAVTHGPDIVQVCAVLGEHSHKDDHVISCLASCWIDALLQAKQSSDGPHVTLVGKTSHNHASHAAQLAFCMLPSSAATCEQLYDACARALGDNQASLEAAQRQGAAATSAAQQA